MSDQITREIAQKLQADFYGRWKEVFKPCALYAVIDRILDEAYALGLEFPEDVIHADTVEAEIDMYDKFSDDAKFLLHENCLDVDMAALQLAEKLRP